MLKVMPETLFFQTETITNTQNNKIYVGSTTNLKGRLAFHKTNNHKSCGSNIGNAIHEFGWCAFKVDILDMCETKEELKFLERKYISELNSNDPEVGYNRNPGGGGVSKGTSRSELHRLHMSEASKGKPKSEEHKRKMSEARIGRKFPRK